MQVPLIPELTGIPMKVPLPFWVSNFVSPTKFWLRLKDNNKRGFAPPPSLHAGWPSYTPSRTEHFYTLNVGAYCVAYTGRNFDLARAFVLDVQKDGFGMPISAEVTHYASPTKLFLRYNFDDSNDDSVPSPAPGVPHVYEVHIGMFCLVFEEKSQRFFRAQVTDVHKNLSGIQVSAEILYVDRGNMDMIGLDCVFPITREVSSKPNMTAPCCIRKECDLEPCAAPEVRRGSYYIYRDLTVQSAVRVRVEDLEKAGSHFQTRVFFVDYGNRKTVSSSCLYKMDAKLAQQGPLALRFQLAGVEPWNAWTDIDGNRFAQLTHSESPLVAVVTGEEKSSDDYGDYIFVVNLKSRTEGEIAERLIRDGHARAPSQRESLIKRIDRSAIEDFSPMDEDYHNSFNSYKVDTDDPGVATADFAVKDESRICKFFSTQGYCRQDEYCIYKHVLGEKNSMILHVKEEVPTCMATLKLPKEGSTVLAQVSYAVSPSNFYLVFPYGHKSIQKLIEKGSSASKERFESLMKTLQVACSCSSFNEDRLVQKSEGELVAARSRDDERWYRAKVVGLSTERNAVRVAFPDFGDEEWVSASWVKTLETRFLRLPFQAVQACLADVEPKGSGRERTWSTEACAVFVESTAGKDLLAEVVGYSENLMQVKLHFCESGKLHSVSSCLPPLGRANTGGQRAKDTEGTAPRPCSPAHQQWPRQAGDCPEQIVTRFRSVETQKKVADGSILNSPSRARETSNGRWYNRWPEECYEIRLFYNLVPLIPVFCLQLWECLLPVSCLWLWITRQQRGDLTRFGPRTRLN
ncbi:hypothetical protein HPB47_000117 [Ixodes persulcatus]|uniref:Uncharacterized protein n=1 Tax=Ixodes persulcatus TaxID=34615 RepID=A0AC60PU65_IXOPE|nr:hypothetical protein HPB47_000117 [Ixodes persulcatus]